LNGEIGDDPNLVDSLLNEIQRVEERLTPEIQFQGREYRLTVRVDGIEVSALALLSDGEEELPEQTNWYDQELRAECGLEDFIDILDHWKHFVPKR